MNDLDQLRQKATELLDEGFRLGQIPMEEHSWRRQQADWATTPEELDVLVADLLDSPPLETPTPGPSLATTAITTILSERELTGRDLAAGHELVTILGNCRVRLDSGAPLPPTLDLSVILGEVTLTVDPSIEVLLESNPVLGEAKVTGAEGAFIKRLRIRAHVVLGSVRVVYSNC